ncbi:MAG: histone deacetylase family protein [Methylomicrobium sp.]
MNIILSETGIARMTTLYYSHPAFLAHDTGNGHPERADRLTAIDKALSAPIFQSLIRKQPELSADLPNKIRLIHHNDMIRNVFDHIPKQGHYALDADTVISPQSGTAALLAVAAVCDAIDQVCTQQAHSSFCAVRPPGHHAEPDRSMGFCLFNNVAIAAEYARTHYHLDKIAIVDFDVHHGNGTQAAFYRQPQVFYASTHEMPHYPGTGHPKETGVGNIVNVPLHSGTTGAEFRDKYRNLIIPALRHFKPDLLLLSAGFDAHKDDPLASIELTEADYRWLTEQLTLLADEYCNGKIVSVLEGGYHLRGLSASVAVHVESLMNPVKVIAE